jgi:hypothetical protein
MGASTCLLTGRIHQSLERQALLLQLTRAEHRSETVKKELLAAIDGAAKVISDLSPSF